MSDTTRQIKRTYAAWVNGVAELMREPMQPILHPSIWRIRWFGMFLLLGNPIFFWLWTAVFPQPYESALLRTVCSAIGLLIILENNTIMTGSRFWRWFYFLAMFIQLPLFFLYMAGQNEWNNVWLGSCVAMALIYYQGTDWRLASWGVLAAVIIIGISYFIQFRTVLYSVDLLVFGCVFIFAWLAALVIGASAANLQKQHLLNTAYNLGVMAHELRTPIASIGLLSSVLKNKRGLIQHDDLLKLSTRLDVLVKTINSHIDNQISNSKLIDIKNTSEIISAKQVIENVIQTFPFKNGIEQSAVKYYCLNNFMFNASETLFTQLLNNLLRNSFKAMAVKEMSDQSKKIHISSYVSKQAYGKLFGFITVADNGTGIQSDGLKKILEPFFSTNDAIGHGLGLSFCQKVVAACKGQLSIKSIFGHSTTITIELPIHSLAAQTDDYV